MSKKLHDISPNKRVGINVMMIWLLQHFFLHALPFILLCGYLSEISFNFII